MNWTGLQFLETLAVAAGVQGIIGRALVFALAAALLSAGAHDLVDDVREALLHRPQRAVLLGLATAASVAIAVVGLGFTVIGIPIALIVSIATVALAGLGVVALGTAVGERLRVVLVPGAPAELAAALGTFLLALAVFTASRLAVVGPFAEVAVGVVAVGGTVLGLIRRRTDVRRHAAPTEPGPGNA